MAAPSRAELHAALFRTFDRDGNGAADYVLYGITNETRARLQRIDVTTSTLVGTVTDLAQAPTLTTYRGVAFAPR